MVVKVYLLEDEEVTDREIFTFGTVLKVVSKKRQVNQNYIIEKTYTLKPLYEKPLKIDKYISVKRVIFKGEPKVFV